MAQVVRQSSDADDGFLRDHRVLLAYRDTKFDETWKLTLEREGIEIVATPDRAPNANAHTERFVQSIERECSSWMELFGGRDSRRALAEYAEHDNSERPHQEIDDRRLAARTRVVRPVDPCEVRAREPLGGLLRSYGRQAE